MNYHSHWHEYNASIHLLLGLDRLASRIERHVFPNEIKWIPILDEIAPNVSYTEYIFIRIAFDLWCGRDWDDLPAVSFRAAVDKLERRQLERVIEAMRILRGDYQCLGRRSVSECAVLPLGHN